jgi:hypothetical protein
MEYKFNCLISNWFQCISSVTNNKEKVCNLGKYIFLMQQNSEMSDF